MNAQRKCPTCGNDNARLIRGVHDFKESGLENVRLLNVEMLVCDKCGEKIVSIPNAPLLVRCIAEEIIKSSRLLGGEEIRFLRKNLHLKISEFARMLGVDRVSVSRWENGHEGPSKSNDRLIRLLYVVRARVSEPTREKVRDYLEGEPSEIPSEYVIPFPLEEQSCATA